MSRTRWSVATASLLLPAALIVGTGTAGAHTRGSSNVHPRPTTVTGMVTGVSANTVQIQTQNNSVNVGWTSSSHVVRMVTATSADLTVNARVALHLVGNTSTVDAVQIELATQKMLKPSRTPLPSATHPPRHIGTPGPTNGAVHVPKGQANHVDGQIVKVSGTTITIRREHGQTATYTLSNNATFTKWMPGKFTDLAIGVEVKAVIAGGKALTITILNA